MKLKSKVKEIDEFTHGMAELDAIRRILVAKTTPIFRDFHDYTYLVVIEKLFKLYLIDEYSGIFK